MKVSNYLFKVTYSCFKGILFVFICVSIFSCSSLKNIEIEVAVLPEYPIGEDIQSLLLLNRSMTNRFTNNRLDSLEKILVNNKLLMDTLLQDSIAADTAVQVAAQSLFESGRFDVVVPKDRNILRTDNEEILKPLDVNFINEICTDFKVDGVLILECFAEQLKTKYYLGKDGSSFNYSYINATTDIKYFSEWRLYRPRDLNRVIRFQMADSIFWSIGSSSVEAVYLQMPRTKEALIGGGIAAGLKMSAYISPSWVNQNRYYYLTGKSEIDAAIPLIKNNKWEEAAEIWEKFASSPSNIIKSKVEFNLALAAEMNGDLALAIEWGLKSFKIRYTKAIEVYLKTLDDKRNALLKENKKRY